MGSAEFEVGKQARSLKRIFALGICWDSAVIIMNGEDVIVHMVAGKGFAFQDYQPHLKQLAENKLHLQEWTNFDTAVRQMVGAETFRKTLFETNAWFDVENDVLWTLNRNKRKVLVGALEGIRRKWAEKAQTEKQ